MPLRANYSLDGLKKELASIGVVVLEEFPDGQVRWGDRPMPTKSGEKFKGRSVMTAPYIFRDHLPRFDIFTVRNILERLNKMEHWEPLQKKLHDYMY